MIPPGPCATCRASHGPNAGHCQLYREGPRWSDDVPTDAETCAEPYARIRAERMVGGPRHRLPEWWYSTLFGDDVRRLDIVLDGCVRVGVTIDGVRAMDGEHDVLRWPDGRFEVVERGEG